MSLSHLFKTTFVLWPRRLLDSNQDGPDPSFTTLLHQQIEAKLKEKNA